MLLTLVNKKFYFQGCAAGNKSFYDHMYQLGIFEENSKMAIMISKIFYKFFKMAMNLPMQKFHNDHGNFDGVKNELHDYNSVIEVIFNNVNELIV